MTAEELRAKAEQARAYVQWLASKYEDKKAKQYLDSVDNRLYSALFRLQKAMKAHEAQTQTGAALDYLQHVLTMTEWSISKERMASIVRGQAVRS